MSLRVVSFWALIVVAMMDNSGVAETHLQFHGSFRDMGPGEDSTFTLDLYVRAGVTQATTISDFERAPSLTSGSYTAEYPIRAHVGITITPPNVLEEAGAYYLLGDLGDDSTLSLAAQPALNGWDQYLQTGDGQLYFLSPETVDGLLGADLSHWSIIPVPEPHWFEFWSLLVVGSLPSRRFVLS
jgi:hypothetical protein